MNRRIFTLTLAGIGLAAAGCTAQPATTSDNTYHEPHEPPADQPDAEYPEEPTAPEPADYGQTITYDDGLTITVTAATATPVTEEFIQDQIDTYGDGAAGELTPGDTIWAFTVEAVNGTSAALDVGAPTAAVYHSQGKADQWATETPDIGGTILPGDSRTGERAFILPEGETDAQLEYGLDWDHPAAVFVGTLKEY